MTKLVKEYLKETGNANFVNIPINGAHLQYIEWLENRIEVLSLESTHLCMAHLDKERTCMVCGKRNCC